MAKSKKGANSFMLAVGVAFVAVALFAFNFLVQGAMTEGGEVEVEIKIAPAVLQYRSKGEVVSVHTDIDYDQVVASTLELKVESTSGPNVVKVLGSKADYRGDLVAYFDLEMVKEAVDFDMQQVEMTLTGDLWDGGTLSGAEYITVR